MQNRWNDTEAQIHQGDPLALRVYTSRLLGRDPNLVLHGGGNTSVKIRENNFFGESTEVLYVKGSGWDLATIEKPGFSPVRLDILLRLAEFETLSDAIIVREQRAALLDPFAPNPSVEAILHAIIPFQYVDHTHADAVVAVMNTPSGEQNVRDIYGDRVLIVPYVMPGFKLARKVYEMTRTVDWNRLDGIILMNHGVFTFHDNARTSYDLMIELVAMAEDWLQSQNAFNIASADPEESQWLQMTKLRKAVSVSAGKPMLASCDRNPTAVGYANLSDLDEIAFQGPLTPDHIIRTKRIPLKVTGDMSHDVEIFANDYRDYFTTHADDILTMLDPAPRWAVWRGQGIVSFGATPKAMQIVSDIVSHTIKAQQWANAIGGWQALDSAHLFEMEYWELEQAKLKRVTNSPLLQGKVALVTGAANGIGRACAEVLAEQGVAVVAIDLSETIVDLFNSDGTLGIQADVTDRVAISNVIAELMQRFGGLDIVVSNAGYFPNNDKIEHMNPETWERSVTVNLTSHQQIMQATIPYLREGIDPTFIIVGSKNVAAPGPGASAYSVMKAGITQLARVAALELAQDGIRVNVVHPDAVFDTSLWTNELLESRAKHYGMTVQDYKTKNLLKTEITSRDVGNLVATIAGPSFAKTTGAQIPIDGGNDRVI